MEKKNFIGIGWSFPPVFLKGINTVQMVSDTVDIAQSLHILLSTRLNERIMRSEFGCNLTPLLFENITTTLLTKMRGIITDAITLHEPRINLNHVGFDTEGNRGRILIEIIYTVRSTNSRHNFVYPFYIKEGTHIQP